MTMTEMKSKSVNNEQMSASADMQEARMYLRRVRTAHRRADLLCAQAEKYRTLAMRATGRTDALRVSGTPQRSNVETYVLELVDTHARLQQEINRLLKYSREAEKLILKLPDENHRAVLQLRYLCAMGWEEVAERLHYSLRWVHKLHADAIAALAEMRRK